MQPEIDDDIAAMSRSNDATAVEKNEEAASPFSNGEITNGRPALTGKKQRENTLPERTPFPRRKVPSFDKIARKGTVLELHSSDNEAELLAAAGTESKDFAEYQLQTLINRATRQLEGGELKVDTKRANAMLAMVAGTNPANELEALLATHIALTADAAANMLEKTKPTQSLELFNARINAVTKLQRTMVAQIEALAKLQRGGMQSVRVEHVHVHQGGQAVVGVINQGGRGNNGNRRQAHASEVYDSEVRGEDAIREALPIPGRDG